MRDAGGAQTSRFASGVNGGDDPLTRDREISTTIAIHVARGGSHYAWNRHARGAVKRPWGPSGLPEIHITGNKYAATVRRKGLSRIRRHSSPSAGGSRRVERCSSGRLQMGSRICPPNRGNFKPLDRGRGQRNAGALP